MPYSVPDQSIDPPEDKVLGYDWNGNEIYGYEVGYWIDNEFIPLDDVQEYLSEIHGLVTAEDVL